MLRRVPERFLKNTEKGERRTAREVANGFVGIGFWARPSRSVRVSVTNVRSCARTRVMPPRCLPTRTAASASASPAME